MRITKHIRWILDIVLTLALLTLYSKNLFGIFYHEVVGLVVLIPIVVHIVINLNMVRGMCRNFKRIPLNVKLCLIVDSLLLLTFLWLGISGVLISKTILTGISTTNRLVKLYHMCIGGWSVILLGIHLGLHICRTQMRTGIAIALTILAFVAGAYGFAGSGIVRWMSMPFAVSGDAPMNMERQLPPAMLENASEHETQLHKDEQQPARGEGHGKGSGEGRGKDAGRGQRPGMGQGAGHSQSGILQKAKVLIQFSGMLFTFAMGTYWIVIWKKKKRSQ